MATATVAQLIAPTALTATLTTTLYTSVAKTILKEMVICNTEASALTVSIFVGTSATIANCILDALSFQAGETKIFTFSTVMAAADQIRGGASAASMVSINASGVTVA